MDETTDSGFPKYQYSVFYKKGRDAQLVVRSNSLEEFKQLIRNIDWITEHIDDEGFAPSAGIDDALMDYTCKQCGAPAQFIAGREKGTGAPYKLVLCTADRNHKDRLG